MLLHLHFILGMKDMRELLLSTASELKRWRVSLQMAWEQGIKRSKISGFFEEDLERSYTNEVAQLIAAGLVNLLSICGKGRNK